MQKLALKQTDSFEADQIEVRAVREGAASVASGALDDRVTGVAAEIGSHLGHPSPEWNQEQEGIEELTGRALDVIKLRRRILGNAYPFRLDRSRLSYEASDSYVYEFCLATCLVASDPYKASRRLLRHFERLACDAIAAHLGASTIGIRVGWPSEDYLDGAPKSFLEKLNWFREKGGFHDDEWKLHDTDAVQQYSAQLKDARIDFAVRCSLFDDRPGAMTWIGQCGCGKNDVDESSRKPEELSDRWLDVVFARTSVARPVKVFATSHHLPTDDGALLLHQVRADAVFIDRLRITLMAMKHGDRFNDRNKKWLKLLALRVLQPSN